MKLLNEKLLRYTCRLSIDLKDINIENEMYSSYDINDPIISQLSEEYHIKKVDIRTSNR